MHSNMKKEDLFARHFSTQTIDNAALITRLKKPNCPVDVVIDTDTYNEVDDQYALAYLIKCEKKLNLKAIYAAPFLNEKSTSPADGMEKSYNEIMNILSLMQRNDLKEIVHQGSTNFLTDELTPVISPAAKHLVQLALEYTPQNPLYVIAIGAITNIASALIINPKIKENIVLIWLGGNALHYPHNCEFNLTQDIAAARVVFGCGVAMVHLPCAGVVSSFSISGPELEHHLRGKNNLCDYLVDVTTTEALKLSDFVTWTRVIWDVTAVAWLTGNFMSDCLKQVPTPEYDNYYAFNPTKHLYKYVYEINRDALYTELFSKLTD